MSDKSGRNRDADRKKRTIPKKTLIVIGVVIVIAIAAVAGYVVIKQGPWAPPNAGVTGTVEENISAAKLYDESVDLANAGKYQEALDKADAALAKNDSAWLALIQSNRAGILVALGRNDEAIAAADAAIAVQGNLTESHAIAWYNKAHALQGIHKNAEAQEAFANASALDPSHQIIPDHL